VGQLRTNRIPKGLIPLEQLYDQDDKTKVILESHSIEDPFIEINVGTQESRRLVKVGKHVLLVNK
jgi:hypothetical protein